MIPNSSPPSRARTSVSRIRLRSAAAVAGRRLGFVGQRLFEAPAVEQGRQKIVIDEVLETAGELLALRNVLDLRNEVPGMAVIVSDERHAQQHPDLMAPGVPIPLLDLIGRYVSVEQIRHLALVDVDVVRV